MMLFSRWLFWLKNRCFSRNSCKGLLYPWCFLFIICSSYFTNGKVILKIVNFYCLSKSKFKNFKQSTFLWWQLKTLSEIMITTIWLVCTSRSTRTCNNLYELCFFLQFTQVIRMSRWSLQNNLCDKICIIRLIWTCKFWNHTLSIKMCMIWFLKYELDVFKGWVLSLLIWNLDNCAPRKIAFKLVLGFGSKSGLVLGLGSTRKMPPRKTPLPLVRVRVWPRVSFGVGGIFPRE